MIYLLKIFIRLALSIFCKEVQVKNRHLLNTKGPLFIIANHPNSFLDAIIIGAYYNRPIFYLARGDVFENKTHRFFLNALNMIPVYRLREGKEYLHLNDYAIRKSTHLIAKGEAVLIFIEGVCINNHELQPFKKGTARILEGLHQLNIFPTIHIAGIAYNNFRGIGKKVNLIISKFLFNEKIESAKHRVDFNKQVYMVLENNIEIPKQPTVIHKQFWYFFHQPYYRMVKNFVAKKTRGTVFFDSVLFSALFFTYPIFLLLLFLFLSMFNLNLLSCLIIVIAIPLLSKNSIS